MMLGAFYEGRHAKKNYQMLLVSWTQLTCESHACLTQLLTRKKPESTIFGMAHISSMQKQTFKLLFHMVLKGQICSSHGFDAQQIFGLKSPDPPKGHGKESRGSTEHFFPPTKGGPKKGVFCFPGKKT